MRSLYPQLDLPSALKYLKKYSAEVLKSRPAGRDHILKLLHFSEKSGAGQTVVGSLIHYGLVEKVNSKYRFSKLAKDILEAQGRPEWNQLVTSAALRPPIFKEMEGLYGSPTFEQQVAELAASYNIPATKVALIIGNFKKSRSLSNQSSHTNVTDYITGDRSNLKSTAKTSFNYPKEDVVVIEFEGGLTIQVPKKVILRAYLEELQRVQNSMV